MTKELTLRDKLQSINFHYVFDVDYTTTEAEDHAERCANDYCRCTTISNFTIGKFDGKDIARHILERLGIEADDKLVLNLAMVCNKITAGDLEFNVEGGYYGEELGAVTLNDWQLLTEMEYIIDIKLMRRKKLEQIAKNK